MLSSMARVYLRYTEAGLRRDISENALGLILDEADTGGSATDRLGQIVELIRLMSARTKAQSVTGGGQDGGSERTSVCGCVWMYGINPPPLSPQDRQRILQIGLGQAPSADGAAAQVEKAVSWATDQGPRLWARVLLGADLYLRCCRAWRSALLERGCSSRQADSLSTLLAGRDVLLRDDPLSPEEMRWDIEGLDDMIVTLRDDDEEDSNPRRCLSELLGHAVESWRGGNKLLIGEVVAAARHEPELSGDNCRRPGCRLRSGRARIGSFRQSPGRPIRASGTMTGCRICAKSWTACRSIIRPGWWCSSAAGNQQNLNRR
ncbi:hypothetical protein WCLP8_3580006 [uncultured Gammaproteobacteria bacterium]